MSWITLRTTSTRWEAELMQQLLAAHEIPSRVLTMGVGCYLGRSSAVVQVRPEDQWTALLLLSQPEEDELD